MKKLILFCIVLAVSHLSSAQSLEQKLKGKTKLTEIMQIVESHLANERTTAAVKKEDGEEEEEFENEYLHWKRWEYYNATRLDENGNIVVNKSRRVWDAFQQYKTNNAAKLNSPNTPLSSYGSWSVFGPTGITRYGAGYNSGYGRVSCIAFHPTDANTLYIGTPQGGIWKTTNHGSSWTVLTDDLPISGISGLVADYNNSNIIYALTGDGDGSGGFVLSYGFAQQSLGILKTTNGGASWQKTGDLPNVTGTFYGYKLIQHPTSPSTLFAATTNGIYKTTNGGTSWTQEQTGNFTDIEFKPGDPTVMYASEKGTSSPFWRSTNSGGTWSNSGITGVPTGTGRVAIGVSDANPAYVYLLTGPATGFGSFKGVYRSTNSGVAFSTRATTPNILGYPNDGSDEKDQDTYDLAIEVDPDNVNVVITGGINIWRSTDGGAGFGTTARTQWYDDVLTIDYVHADIHNITYNPLNGRVYSCSDGGVGYSTDDGANWSFISSSLQILATYHADYYEANGSIIACGTQDNGTNIRYTASNTYRHINGADGFDCVIKDNDTDTILFVGNGSIFRTNDGGLNKTNVSPAGVGNFPSLARDYNNNRTVFAGDGSNVYKSTNFGGSWSTSSAGVGSRVLTTCPSNSDRLYCGTGSTLLRSDNATAAAASITYTTISGNPGWPTGVTLSDVEVYPSNSLYVYATFGGFSDGKKVIRSTDGGDSWSDYSGSLPNVPCQSVAVDANGVVYVGTDVGVFIRTTAMTDWQPFFNNLPKAPVSELMINNSTGVVTACTFGRGNFFTDIYSTCPVSLGLSGTMSGYKFYNASDFITSTTTVSQGVGNNAALKAGNYVQLNPGFEVSANSEFKAWIGPCSTGGLPFRVTTMTDKIPMDSIYIVAGEGVRYPYANISSILPQKDGAVIHVTKAGSYSWRITNMQGNVVNVVATQQQLQPGDITVNWNRSALQNGQYYDQLFRGDVMVHFHEFDVR